MADDLVKITDRLTRTVNGILYQFKGLPNSEAIMASYGQQFQELEDMFIDLYLLQCLANATGQQLDELGVIVGLERGDRDDDNYRAALYGKIALNRTNARIEDLLLACTQIDDGTDYELTELGDATIKIQITPNLPSGIEIETYNDTLQAMKSGGVRLHIIYSTFANYFQWADADAKQTDAGRGWSNDSRTNGGYWGDVAG